MEVNHTIRKLGLAVCLVFIVAGTRFSAYASVPPYSLNPFYSEYDPGKFNDSGSMPGIGITTDHIQYRMNCYGYAFRYLLQGSVVMNSGGGYKQQPGEFRDTGGTAYSLTGYSGSELMNRLRYNVGLDASRLGFSVQEYQPSGTTVPQFGVGSRLIAVVAGKYVSDYHFYIQHNDGTWSHKPGSGGVTNLALTSGVILTNANIIQYAKQGVYTDGELTFLLISRDAIIDHPHSARNAYGRVVSLYDLDVAGDYPETSVSSAAVGSGGMFDFGSDVDFFYFCPPSSGNYSVYGSSIHTGASIRLGVFDVNGNLLGYGDGSNWVSFLVYLSSGNTYFIGMDDQNGYQTFNQMGIN